MTAKRSITFSKPLPENYMDKKFHDFFNLQGFLVQEIEGDGNCLFRSIADALDNDQEKHFRYRRLAVQHIRAQVSFKTF